MENEVRFNEICNKHFNRLKTNWSYEDIQEIYEAYNILNSSDKKDTGCGTCRRATIIEVRDYYLKNK
jgi:hypothetical protein